MWKINKENTNNQRPAEAGKHNVQKWVDLPIGKWVLMCGGLMIRKLEQMDSALSNRQRKWLFYLGISCCSGLLLYLLGSGIRRPPALFVPLPAAYLNSPVKSYPLQSGQDRNERLIIP